MRLLIPLILILILAVIGIKVYHDYGVPWDEVAQLDIAQSNFNYIFKNDPDLLKDTDRYYGTFFELPLWWLSHLFPRPERVYIRHLMIYGIFVIGVIVFYLIGKQLFKNTYWGLLGAVLLVASPRIFADAFYNSKDIPFMVAFIFAVWVSLNLIDALHKPNNWRFIIILMIIHAVSCAILISTRVAGVIILLLSSLLFIPTNFGSKSGWKRNFILFVIDFAFIVSLTIIFWPILWHDPLNEFIAAFREMGQYPFNPLVLYQGQYFTAPMLPWHYLPVWIGITTPILILIGAIVGILDLIFSGIQLINYWVREKVLPATFSIPDALKWVLVAGWLIFPIIAIYLFHSVLYDGWRQMFFIYPALILVAIRGSSIVYAWMIQHTRYAIWARLVLLSVLVVGLAEPIGFMIRFHPYQNVYFNFLAGNPATLRQRFELDYWGLSYKQAIDDILAHETEDPIVVSVATPSGKYYRDTALSIEQRERLYLTTDVGEAKYFISNFRWHPDDYPYQDEFYSVDVRGTKIIVVYKLR
jgi:hypothetical protein